MSLDLPLGFALAVLVAMAGWELACLLTVGHHSALTLSMLAARFPIVGVIFALVATAVWAVIVVHLLTETELFS